MDISEDVLFNTLAQLVKKDISDLGKKLKEEQDILNGLRQYAKATLVYALKNTLNYKLRGNYQEFTGKHSFYDEIFFINLIQPFIFYL